MQRGCNKSSSHGNQQCGTQVTQKQVKGPYPAPCWLQTAKASTSTRITCLADNLPKSSIAQRHLTWTTWLDNGSMILMWPTLTFKKWKLSLSMWAQMIWETTREKLMIYVRTLLTYWLERRYYFATIAFSQTLSKVPNLNIDRFSCEAWSVCLDNSIVYMKHNI